MIENSQTKEWNHFDENGNAVMVDVSQKEITERIAVASGKIKVNREVMEAIVHHTAKKGDVLGVARVAGIMGTKQTSSLIPMCHPLCLNKSTIDFYVNEKEGIIEAVCTVKVSGKTGVEMEALMGVNTALLTIYDMCKAMDRRMELFDIGLIRKEGGKSGVFVNQKQNQECTLDENAKKPAIVAVSGIKNSGKTTFLENLIQVLIGRGISTAVIKHDGHSFETDRKGTDTGRLKQAGAVGVAIFCDTHYMVINDKTANVEELASEFKNVDLILVEGMKQSSYPKIEIVREANSQESICPKDTLLAVATDCRKEFQVPKIALDDYEKAADLIQKCIGRIEASHD